MLAVNDNTARDTRGGVLPRDTPYYSPSQKSRVKTGFGRLNLISMWGCILFCGAVFWWVAGQGAKIDAANYQIDKLQAQIQQQTAENASLTTTVDALSQPARILRIANQLGLKYASGTAIISTSSQHSADGE